MTSQSSLCGCIGLLSLFALIFLMMGMKTESITRYKAISVFILTISAGLTVLEPVLWDKLEISSFINHGLVLSVIGILLLALFFVILVHKIEHTHIHKPMLFGFIGLYCMLFMWIFFIPLHIFNWEVLVFLPSKDQVYWNILGVVVLGTVIPFYLIQWVLTRTSILFVCVLLGSIIPLYGITESIYFLEFNWINLISAIFSIISIVLINYRYK